MDVSFFTFIFLSSIYRLHEVRLESHWAIIESCTVFAIRFVKFQTRNIFLEEIFDVSHRRKLHTCHTFFYFSSIYVSFVTRKIFFKFEERKAFFSRWLESVDSGWHSLISRPPSNAAPCYRCTGTMHFLPRRPPFSNGSSSSLRLSLPLFARRLSLPSFPLLFDPSHYGSFCARMNAAVHRRFHDNGTGHSERHKY